MKYKKLSLIPILGLLLISCSNEIEDSTVAAPEHYKVEFENEYVRVVRVAYNPGEESEMHSHSPLVAVSLTGGQGIFTDQDGNEETRPEAFAGDVLTDPGSSHSVLSISKGYEELVFIEPKKSFPFSINDVPNAIELDDIDSKIELEEFGVRAIRMKGKPGSESPYHSHRAGVIVALTDVHVEHTTLDGETSIVKNKAGTASWAEPRVHKGKVLSQEGYEAIFFELM